MLRLLKGRLFTNVVAQGYSQGIFWIYQLISVPVYLSVWSTTEYAIWILGSSLPSLLAILDLGLASAAGNEMVKCKHEDNFVRARSIFSTVFSFSAGMFGLITILGVVAVSLFSLLSPLSDLAVIVFYMGLYSALYLFWSPYVALLRYYDKNEYAVYLTSSFRAFEYIILIVTPLLGASAVTTALVALISRLLGVYGCLLITLRSDSDRLCIDCPAGIDWKTVKSLMPASSGYIVPTVSTIVILQMQLILAKLLLDEAAVILLNVLKSFSRAFSFVAGLVSNAAAPEISKAYYSGNVKYVAKLMSRQVNIVAAVCFLGVALGTVFGPELVGIWTRGQVEIPRWLICVVLVDGLAFATWISYSILLKATNQAASFAKAAALIVACLLIITAVGGRWMGLPAVVALSLVFNVVLALWAVSGRRKINLKYET